MRHNFPTIVIGVPLKLVVMLARNQPAPPENRENRETPAVG